MLALVPERGEPINTANSTNSVYQLPFGDGHGLLTYLLLTSMDRVDVLLVSFEQEG